MGEVDTSSPEILLSEVKYALTSALHALDAGDTATAVWALDKANEQADELAEALGL